MEYYGILVKSRMALKIVGFFIMNVREKPTNEREIMRKKRIKIFI